MQDVSAGKHAVCIDDDDAILRVVERTLLGAGFRVTTTTSPKEALALVTREHVDAFVCDLRMPEMNGDLLLAMAAQVAPRTVRVLLTGDNDFTRIAALTVPYSVQAFIAKRDLSSRLVPFLKELLGVLPEAEEAAAEAEARGLAQSIVGSIALRQYETLDHCRPLSPSRELVASSSSRAEARALSTARRRARRDAPRHRPAGRS